MELEKCINGRRSVRSYQDKPVSKEDIAKILKAGVMAPSSRNRKPWKFIVITNKEKIREISAKVKSALRLLGGKFGERAESEEDVIFYEAPLLILIVAEEEPKSTLIDCVLAAENMMLEGYNLGLGSCYIGLMNKMEEDSVYLKTLGINENQKLYCPLIFGYPTVWPQPKDRKPIIQKRID